MISSLSVQTYLDAFKSLHCQVVGGKKNPAKALIVLSILDLISDGRCSENQVNRSDIEEQYKKFQNKYNVPTPYQYPLYFMENELFYHLKWRSGKIKTHTPSAKLVRENVEYAYLDNELWELLQDEGIRSEFRSVIEDYYLK